LSAEIAIGTKSTGLTVVKVVVVVATSAACNGNEVIAAVDAAARTIIMITVTVRYSFMSF
jgi:hypothetical protein